MRLKRLELVGFKSFADKTQFDFNQGLTAFIGPNGCGKSNIVDAFLWILGEQSPRALRAREMADLIFSAENGRGPMGYCESSLVLQNGSADVPLDAEEISLTRRLYRSGESDYLINGKSCRLRDMRDLLLGTGLGVDAYSIVPQGKVELLLQANPRDRRAILEEAAGVSKYKKKRDECLRRLEHVRQDLVRITDVIAEVQRQLRSVKLQASRARRYRELTQLLTEVEIALALHGLHLLTVERGKVLDNLDLLAKRDEQLRSQVEELESQLQTAQTLTAEKEKIASAAQGELLALDAEVRAARDKIESHKQRISELDETEDRARGQLAELHSKLSSLEAELTTLAAQLQHDADALAQAAALLEDRQTQSRALQQERQTLDDQIAIAKEEVFTLLQTGSRLNNELSAIRAERKALASRTARLREKQAELRDELHRTSSRSDCLGEKISHAQSNIRDCRDRLSGLQHLRSAAESELASIKQESQRTRSDAERLRSRRELLEDLERKREGVRPAVRAVLEERAAAETALSGVIGMLADLIQVDIAQAKAVEALLGEAAEAIVAENLDGALAVAAFLRQKKLGSAWIVPLELFTASSSPSGHDPVRGVSCAHQYHPLLSALMRRFSSVSSLDDAAKLINEASVPLRYVTPEGDVVEPEGIIKLGGGKSGGIISRRSELRKLHDDITSLDTLLSQLEEKASGKDAALERIAQSQELLRGEEAKWAAALAQLETELAAVRARNSELQDALSVNSSELDELNQAIREAAQAESDLQQQIDAASAEQRGKQEFIARMTEKKEAAEARLSDLANEITRLKIDLAQLEERKEAVQARIQKLNESVADQRTAISRAGEEIDRCGSRKRALDQDISAIEEELAGSAARKENLQSRIDSSRRESRQLQTQTSELRVQLAERQQACETVARQREESRLRSTELRIKMENLCEKTQTDYSRNLLALYGEYEEDDSTDWSQLQTQATEVRKKRDRLGSVNLEAISEQDRLQERFEFLTSQRDDLERAAASINNTINRLDATCRKLFTETFEQVKDNFRGLFRKLFGGGKAELFLEEGVDVLEAGIEIIAQPPGKNLRSISLLSGGEKALTAVALLFAVFKSKAAPFCILDEVDAALDENNIGRFIAVLKDFVNTSQFIIITHCKRTMAMADLLYGITMQEKGVSKTVSVEMRDLRAEEAA